MTLNLKNNADRETWKTIKSEINKTLQALNFKAQFDNFGSFDGFCWGEKSEDSFKINTIQIPNECFACEEVEIELHTWKSIYQTIQFSEDSADEAGVWRWGEHCYKKFNVENLSATLFDLAYIAPRDRCFLSIFWRDKHCHTENSLDFCRDKIDWRCVYLDSARSKSGEMIDNLVTIFDGTLISR